MRTREEWIEKPMAYDSPLVGRHFRNILRQAIKMAELDGRETVLDFGCGSQELKKFLPQGIKYIGFDVVGKTDVEDCRGLKPDVIFCLGVLEYLHEGELAKTLKNFRAMKPKKIVVTLPCMNVLNRLIAFLLGLDAQHFFFQMLPSKTVSVELNTAFGLPSKFKRIRLLQYCAVFEVVA